VTTGEPWDMKLERASGDAGLDALEIDVIRQRDVAPKSGAPSRRLAEELRVGIDTADDGDQPAVDEHFYRLRIDGRQVECVHVLGRELVDV
jgi:hypothetical protein